MSIVVPQKTIPRAAAVYYVRKDGSDSNSGLENTAAGAFATIEAVLNLLKSIVGNGQAVEILLWDALIANPHLLPSDSNDFRDYSKITIKANPDINDDCYIRVDVNNFGNFNELALLDVSLIEGIFGGVLTVSESTKFFMQGCAIDDPLAIVLTDGTRGDINSNSFGTTYAAGDGAFLVRRGGYLKYRNTNLNGATVVQATAAFFLCTEGGEIECAEILNGLAGEIANVQSGGKVRLPAGSDINFSFDPSSEVIVGTQVYNYDNSDSGSSATDYKAAIDEALSSGNISLIKPLRPGTAIYVSQSTGDNLETGFVFANPVQTFDRVIEILNTYDWGFSTVTVVFLDYLISSTLQFSLGQVDNLNSLNFDGQNVSDLSASVIMYNLKNIGVVSWSNWIMTSGGRVAAFDANAAQFNGMDAQANTALALFEVDGADIGTVSNLKTTGGSTVNVAKVLKCNDVARVNVSVSSDLPQLNVTNTFVECDRVNFLEFSGTPRNITGRVFDIGTENCAVSGAGVLTGTVNNIYPPSTIIDGDNRIRGQYADDATAGANGVLTGEYYQTPGGVLMVKQ